MQMMIGADDSDSAALIGHGFLLDGDVFITIDHPDAVTETAASAINNRGQIVGGYVDAEGTIRGFLLKDGVFTPIDHPDAGAGPSAGTVARDTNKRGQIVGFYVDAEGEVHGFLRDKQGVFTPIDQPGCPSGTGDRNRSLRHQRPWPGRGLLRRRRSSIGPWFSAREPR
jgi:probable HAF family extracellular repeat protein